MTIKTNPRKVLFIPQDTNKVGDIFQKSTAYRREELGGKSLDWAHKPPTYKTYPNCDKVPLIPIEKIQLGWKRLKEVISLRHSVRNFQKTPITIEQLSYLLWASTGISRRTQNFEFRTAPSAGALYPIETYVSIQKESEFPVGIYHYNIFDHSLEKIKEGNYSSQLSSAALGQKMVSNAPIVFLWSAIFDRSKWKYEERAYRYIYLDAGHIAAQLSLAAVELGLGSCQIGAIFDSEMNRIIELDGESESIIYISVIGQPNF